MTNNPSSQHLSRRDFLKIAGGAAFLTAGASVLPHYLRRVLLPESVAQAQYPDYDLFYAGTDGWISLPPTPPVSYFHPDPLAPSPFTTYIFGFRNVSGLSESQVSNQKNKAQHSAPLFWLNQFDPNDPVDFRMQLTNLGLALRPDLFDAHTIHWHGFRNVIPFFDGEPTGSVSVPTGSLFTYIYRPREEGTYMFHCHVEDVEHVHMGMTGLVFVRPLQNGNTSYYPSGKYAYNDGDGSTGYDREFAMFLSEVWAESHWADAHIQLPEWSDYRADFALLNGRVYPDTLAPNSPINAADSVHALAVETDANGDLVVPPAPYEHLQYQPQSSLVTCQAGERVLLRFANLGFKESAITLAGIQMRVIGRDATLMRGRGGADTSYETDTISISAGESFDVLFTAPAHSGGIWPRIQVPALQPGLHPLQQPGARRFRRPDDRSPRLPQRGVSCAAVSQRLGRHLADRFKREKELTMHTSKTKWIRLGVVLLLMLGVLSSGPLANIQPAAAQGQTPSVGIVCTSDASPNPTFSLTTNTGYIMLPDGNTMYMWGYSNGNDPFQHPGPVLCVNQGDTVTVVLNNTLPEATSILFPGQENVLANGVPAQPQFDGGGNLTSLTNVAAARSGSVTYSFVASEPGTYIYESGTNPRKQVGMGLFGALIVRPTMGADFAYNRSDSQFMPQEEFLVLLSEIDPYQHQAAEQRAGLST